MLGGNRLSRNYFDSYISDLCGKIFSESDRKVASDELYDHLMSHYEECIKDGQSEDEAAKNAINSFGDKEQLKKKIASSFNRKNKLLIFFKIIACFFISIIAVFVGYILLLILSSGVTSSNINKYEKLLANIPVYDERVYEYSDFYDGIAEIPIFPETIENKDEVADFKYVYYQPWDANYFWYLVMDYNSEEYTAEVSKLTAYKSSGTIGYYYNVTGTKPGFTLLSEYSSPSTLIYAVSDSSNKGRIIYVGFNFCNGFTDINFRKYLKDEYILENFQCDTREKSEISNDYILKSAERLVINDKYDIEPSYDWNYLDVYSSKIVSVSEKADSVITVKIEPQYICDEFLGNGFRIDNLFDNVICHRIDEKGNILNTPEEDLGMFFTEESGLYELIMEYDEENYNGTARYVFRLEK